MSKAKVPAKRGPGRPKSTPVSGNELRRKALAGIEAMAKKRAQEAEVIIPEPDIDEVIERASAVTRKHKYTKEEMEDLREKLDFIYQKYLEEQWQAEADNDRELNKKLHEISLQGEAVPAYQPMSEEDWNINHGFRADGSRKRGPTPKKKKTIWEIEPGEKGTAMKPSEPMDLDALEAEMEARMMEQYIEEQKSEPQFRKGRRVSRLNPQPTKRETPKSFWV